MVTSELLAKVMHNLHEVMHMPRQGSGSYDIGVRNAAAGRLSRDFIAVLQRMGLERRAAGGGRWIRKQKSPHSAGFWEKWVALSHVDGDEGQQEHQHAANHGQNDRDQWNDRINGILLLGGRSAVVGCIGGVVGWTGHGVVPEMLERLDGILPA
jgi:hypothetical protein